MPGLPVSRLASLVSPLSSLPPPRPSREKPSREKPRSKRGSSSGRKRRRRRTTRIKGDEEEEEEVEDRKKRRKREKENKKGRQKKTKEGKKETREEAHEEGVPRVRARSCVFCACFAPALTVLASRGRNALVVFVQVPHVVEQEPHLGHRRGVGAGLLLLLLLQQPALQGPRGAAQRGAQRGAGGVGEHRRRSC